MISTHITNILVHAGTGIVALALGFAILAMDKGTRAHQRLGNLFCLFTLMVCLTAIVGLVCFRFMPNFAVITLLVLYQLVGGWRAAKRRTQRPAFFDACWTLIATVFLISLLPPVTSQTGGTNTIAISTFGAIAFVLIYDSVRFFFPNDWHKYLWRYEHVYKLLSALFGMLSALVGNVVRLWQPWSQLIPSAIGIAVIIYFLFKLYKEETALSSYPNAK